MDAAGAAERSQAVVEVLVAGRTASLRIAVVWRCRSVHDDRIPMGRVRRRHSALVVFHAAQKARTTVEPRRHLGIWSGNRHGHFGSRDWRVEVLAAQAISIQ